MQISRRRLSGRFSGWLLAAAAGVLLFSATACEDDPLVEPKGETKTGGSYGGRLTQPQSASGNADTATYQPVRRNPEVF